MKLGSWKHTTQEKKRYTVSYDNWLGTGEVISTVVYAIEPTSTVPLVVESSAVDPDGLGITFYVSGGENETEYQINVLATTDAGQRKEDYITIIVEDV